MQNSHRYAANYQMPLRLSDSLAEELHEVHLATGIQKSKLCRMGISRLIKDLQESGASSKMGEISRYYEEIL